MLARGATGDGGGSLITCGSLSVTHGVARLEHYAAAKGALASVTRSLAVELGGHGIRANMVLPGRIATDLGNRKPDHPPPDPERARVIPIPRIGTPEDCAGIVVYLLSDAASYHTGDLITVDGGLSVGLRYFFGAIELTRFPLPWHQLSFYAVATAGSPRLDRCRDWCRSRTVTVP